MKNLSAILPFSLGLLMTGSIKVNYRVNGQPAEFTGTAPEMADLLEQE